MSTRRAERMDVELCCCSVAHEANRIYCLSLGDDSQPSWENAPKWQRESMIVGVRGVLSGNTPIESHECWLRQKREDGWSYGPIKNVQLKQHPCMVPYDELPPEQQKKDHLFSAIVRAMARALGVVEERKIIDRRT